MRQRAVIGLMFALCFVFGLKTGPSYADGPTTLHPPFEKKGAGDLLQRGDREVGEPKQPATADTVGARVYIRDEMKARLLEAAKNYLNRPETKEKIRSLVSENQEEIVILPFKGKDRNGKENFDPGSLLIPVDDQGKDLGTEPAFAVKVPAESIGLSSTIESIRLIEDPQDRSHVGIEAILESADIDFTEIKIGVAYRSLVAKPEKPGLDSFKPLPIASGGNEIDSFHAQVRIERPVIRLDVALPAKGPNVVIQNLEVELPQKSVHAELRGLPDKLEVRTPEGGRIGVGFTQATRERVTKQIESQISERIESLPTDPLFRGAVLGKIETTATSAAQNALNKFEISVPLQIRKKIPPGQAQLLIAYELETIVPWKGRRGPLGTLGKDSLVNGFVSFAEETAAEMKELSRTDPASEGLILLAEALRSYFLEKYPNLKQLLPQWAGSSSIKTEIPDPAVAASFLDDLAGALAKEKSTLPLDAQDFRMIQKASLLRDRFLGPIVAVRFAPEQTRLRDGVLALNLNLKDLNNQLLPGNIVCDSGPPGDGKSSEIKLSLDSTNHLFEELYKGDDKVFDDLIGEGFHFLSPPVIYGMKDSSKVRLTFYGIAAGTDLGGTRMDGKFTVTVEGEVMPTPDGKGITVQAVKLISASEKRFTAERLLHPVNWFATQIFNVGSLASTGIARGKFNRKKESLRKEIELEILKSSGGRITSINFNKDDQMEIKIVGDEAKP